MATVDDDSDDLVDGDEQLGEVISTCDNCGALTRRDIVRAAFWVARGLVAIEDIDAWVCDCCGEQFYRAETAERIEQIVHGLAGTPKREMIVPVYSLADAPKVPSAGDGQSIGRQD